MRFHLVLLIIALSLILAGQAAASHWFVVKNVTPVEMTANSTANFTVSVKGLGSERAFVTLVFKNVSEGLEMTCPKMIKNVYPAGTTDYNCSVKAGDIQPGNYSFDVDVAATGSPSGKKRAFVNIVEAKGGAGALTDDLTQPEASESQELGAVAASHEGSDEGFDEGSDEGPVNEEVSSSQHYDDIPKETPAPGAFAAVLSLLFAVSLIRKKNRNRGKN